MTEESRALQRWRLVKNVFFGDEPVRPAARHFVKSERSRARSRWSFVRRTFQIEKQPQKATEEQVATTDVMSNDPDAVKNDEGTIAKEPSLTAEGSPYRSALMMLESFNWQFLETDRTIPMTPSMPQLSTVHYHPNHEAFFDEDTGHPIAKVSTRSFMNRPSVFFGQSGLMDVEEENLRKPSVHDVYSRKKKIPSFRLRNWRFTITQTFSRYLRSCTRPDVKV